MTSGTLSGASSHIELGLVGAPFGVRGWVKLHSYTDPPDRLLAHRQLQLKLGSGWKKFAIEADGRRRVARSRRRLMRRPPPRAIATSGRSSASGASGRFALAWTL